MYGGMITAYGYRCTAADLAYLEADQVMIDSKPERPSRDAMLRLQARGPGDEVRLMYLRHLGGSPVADRVWREKIEAKGVKVTVVPPMSAPTGRPKDNGKLPPEHEDAARVVWLGQGVETVRLAQIEDLVGHPVGKGLLVHRFGVPSNPKPKRINGGCRGLE